MLKRKRVSDVVKDYVLVFVAMFGALLFIVLATLYHPALGIAVFCWVLTQWSIPWPE